MLHAKIKLFGAAIAAILASQALCYGQPQQAPAAAPPASSQYRPLTEADAQADLDVVKAAVAALDERFATAGASAEGWKEYLSWSAFEAELQKPKPDQALLGNAYKKLASGYEGLELKSFSDLRTALFNYLLVAGSGVGANLEPVVKGQIDALTKELDSLGPNPTTQQLDKIADHLLWLGATRQAPDLTKAVRERFSAANFQVHISKELLDLGVGGPVDEVAPINDVILGTVIHGTGHTVGQTEARVTPDPNFATFDTVLQAMNHSESVGYHRPVCIYTTGETGLAAVKRLWIDGTGIHTYPTAASAQTSTTINNIVSTKGRRFVEKMAWRRAGKQKSEAEAIAGQHAAGNLGARVNEQVDPQTQNANERFEAKVHTPLIERRAYPRVLNFATLATGLQIGGITGLATQLGAPGAPPALTQPAELSVCVHESMLNNLAESIFTGMHLTDEMAQRTAIALTGSVPEKLKSDANQEPFTIVFPPEQIQPVRPISVSFADNGFTVTLRGNDFISGDRHQATTNVTASYKFTKTPDGYKAVRQGELQIYRFGEEPGAKRSALQQGLHTVLQNKFGKIFTPEIKLQGFHFAQGRLSTAGQFVPQEIISRDGWIAIGYARAKPASATAANN